MLKTENEGQIIETRRLPAPMRRADRNLAVTPLDLRQAKFSTAIRGFDRNEVTSLLQEAAEGYDETLIENERLRQDIARLESSLQQYRTLEDSLKATLISAQRLADETKENAAKDAAKIVKDAEARAEVVVQQGQLRYDDVLREIEALKLKRREAETNIEATIFALRGTLDFVREQDPKDRLASGDKVVQHRPREITSAPVTVQGTVVTPVQTPAAAAAAAAAPAATPAPAVTQPTAQSA
jgi:cell division initiation protein